jgi:uncharacterized protein (UPF0261 family)
MQQARKTFLAMGTLTTKQREMDYLCACLTRMGQMVRVQDLSLERYIQHLDGSGESKIAAMEKTVGVVLSEILPLVYQHTFAGIIAMGGGVGTWLAGRIMRQMPDSLPKIMLSTLPFDPREVIGSSNIVIVPSIVDILGTNPVLQAQIHQAAALLTGWADRAASPQSAADNVIGMTALGITTPAVSYARAFLESQGYDIAAFHANGTGDDAFERFTAQGTFCAVLDMTPSALTSHLFGGVARCTLARMEAAGRVGIPQVVVPGGICLVSRGPLESLRAEDRARPHYRQNVMFTHVRLDRAQMRQTGAVMAAKLNQAVGPTAVVIPRQGFSSEDRMGGAIFDPEGNQAFVDELAASLRIDIRVHPIDAHINTDKFAKAACTILMELMGVGVKAIQRKFMDE